MIEFAGVTIVTVDNCRDVASIIFAGNLDFFSCIRNWIVAQLNSLIKELFFNGWRDKNERKNEQESTFSEK